MQGSLEKLVRAHLIHAQWKESEATTDGLTRSFTLQIQPRPSVTEWLKTALPITLVLVAQLLSKTVARSMWSSFLHQSPPVPQNPYNLALLTSRLTCTRRTSVQPSSHLWALRATSPWHSAPPSTQTQGLGSPRSVSSTTQPTSMVFLRHTSWYNGLTQATIHFCWQVGWSWTSIQASTIRKVTLVIMEGCPSSSSCSQMEPTSSMGGTIIQPRRLYSMNSHCINRLC